MSYHELRDPAPNSLMLYTELPTLALRWSATAQVIEGLLAKSCPTNVLSLSSAGKQTCCVGYHKTKQSSARLFQVFRHNARCCIKTFVRKARADTRDVPYVHKTPAGRTDHLRRRLSDSIFDTFDYQKVYEGDSPGLEWLVWHALCFQCSTVTDHAEVSTSAPSSTHADFKKIGEDAPSHSSTQYHKEVQEKFDLFKSIMQYSARW